MLTSLQWAHWLRKKKPQANWGYIENGYFMAGFQDYFKYSHVELMLKQFENAENEVRKVDPVIIAYPLQR